MMAKGMMTSLKTTWLIATFLVASQSFAAITVSEAGQLALAVHRVMSTDLQATGRTVNFRWIEGSPEFMMKTMANNAPNSYTIQTEGGVYRNKQMTPAIYAMMLCHEFGHVLGGAPLTTEKFAVSTFTSKLQIENLKKLSAEGQADYFATNVCMPRVLTQGSFALNLETLTAEQKSTVVSGCTEMNPDAMNRQICMSSAVLSAQMLDIFAQLPSQPENAPTLETVNAENGLGVGVVATSILDGYPSLQCRLQTLFSGSLHSGKKTIYDPRPRCWLAPEDSEAPRVPREIASVPNDSKVFDPFIIPAILQRGEGKSAEKP